MSSQSSQVSQAEGLAIAAFTIMFLGIIFGVFSKPKLQEDKQRSRSPEVECLCRPKDNSQDSFKTAKK